MSYDETVRALAGLLIALAGVTSSSPPGLAAGRAVEIIGAKVDRFGLLPTLLAPEWFVLEQRNVGKVHLNVPEGSDINVWLETFRGKSMKVLVYPGGDYQVRPDERAVRDTVEYAYSPEDFGHNFFVGNIDLVVRHDPDDDDQAFIDQKRLRDKVMRFVGQEVVLIFRPD